MWYEWIYECDCSIFNRVVSQVIVMELSGQWVTLELHILMLTTLIVLHCDSLMEMMADNKHTHTNTHILFVWMYTCNTFFVYLLTQLHYIQTQNILYHFLLGVVCILYIGQWIYNWFVMRTEMLTNMSLFLTVKSSQDTIIM